MATPPERTEPSKSIESSKSTDPSKSMESSKRTDPSKGPGSGYVDDWQSGKTPTECNLHMLTTENCADVTFLVGKDKKKIKGHRYILISRSCVFHAMLSGPLAEKSDISVPDVEATIFFEMMKYLYTNEVAVTPDSVTGLLYLGKKYSVGGLERMCLEYLEASLTTENACIILEQAHTFDEPALLEKALRLVVQEGDDTFRTPGFCELCHQCFDRVIKSEELSVKPEHMFSAALMWGSAECDRKEMEPNPESLRLVLGESLYSVNFTTMCREFFVKQVVPSSILTADESNKILCKFVCPDIDISPFTADLGLGVFKKTFTICRFRAIGTTSLQCCGDIVDSIFMSCSNDIVLHGFQLYCPFNEVSATYTIYTSIRTIQGILVGGSCVSTTIQAKPFEKPVFDVYLNTPILLRKTIQHRISILINGGFTYQGTAGLSRVIHGKNCFQFAVSSGGRFRSSISDGQIPSFILSEPENATPSDLL